MFKGKVAVGMSPNFTLAAGETIPMLKRSVDGRTAARAVSQSDFRCVSSSLALSVLIDGGGGGSLKRRCNDSLTHSVMNEMKIPLIEWTIAIGGLLSCYIDMD